jgi:hypothetical protein
MESVIIIVPRGVPLELLIESVRLACEVESASGNWLLIKSKGRRAFIGDDPAVRDELEPNELDKLLLLIPEPSFYPLDYSDIEFCKELLRMIVDRSDVLVDNSHGIVCSGVEFLSMIQSLPGWDWR